MEVCGGLRTEVKAVIRCSWVNIFRNSMDLMSETRLLLVQRDVLYSKAMQNISSAEVSMQA